MEKNKPIMKPKSLKKVFTVENKQALCQEWRQSGLSMRQFCSTKRISTSALYQWCRNLYPKTNDVKKNWVPVKGIQNQEIKIEDSVSIELSLPNQSVARVRVLKSDAISFLKEIYNAASTIR